MSARVFAVPLSNFVPNPTIDTAATPPYERLRQLASSAAGAQVTLADVELAPPDFGRLRQATAIWLMLQGRRPNPDSMPQARFSRRRDPGYAYVVIEGAES